MESQPIIAPEIRPSDAVGQRCYADYAAATGACRVWRNLITVGAAYPSGFRRCSYGLLLQPGGCVIADDHSAVVRRWLLVIL